MRKMRIFILGKEGPDTYALTRVVTEALQSLNIPYTMRHIDDDMQIMMYGVFILPAFVTDDIVRCIGRVPELAEVKNLLKAIVEYEEKNM